MQQNNIWYRYGYRFLLVMALCIILVCIFGCKTGLQNESMTMSEKPMRIASYGVSTDDILLEMVTPSRVGTVSRLSGNMPDKVSQVAIKTDGSIESILKAKPDLVVMPDWVSADKAEQMKAVGLRVYLYPTPQTIPQIYELLFNLGKVTHEPERAQEMAKQMKMKLAEAKTIYRKSGQEKKVAVMYSSGGVRGGKDSTFNTICEYASLINGAALYNLKQGEKLSKESLVELNPDIIIVPSDAYDTDTYHTPRVQEILTDPSLQSMKAVKNRAVYVVDARKLFSYSQFITDAVYEMTEYAYGSNY